MHVNFCGSDMRVNVFGHGSPVLWIHGFPLSSEVFRDQVGIDGFLHIAPDLPGFGESAPFEAEQTLDVYGDAVIAAADAAGAKKAIIAGVSMGGYIAMSILRRLPERVAGLVLIDTRETADDEKGKATRFEQADRIRREGIGFVVDDMLPKMLSSKARTEDEDLVSFTRTMMLTTSSSGAISALHAMAGRLDSAEALREFEGPALIVVGSEDPITPRVHAERMHGLMRNAELLVLEGCAHLSNLETPGEFNAAFERFARGITAKS